MSLMRNIFSRFYKLSDYIIRHNLIETVDYLLQAAFIINKKNSETAYHKLSHQVIGKHFKDFGPLIIMS